MKKITFLGFALLLFFASGCGDDHLPSDCIDPDRIRSGACTLDYNPVCGCDGKTYPNACTADLSGLKTWTTGECK